MTPPKNLDKSLASPSNSNLSQLFKSSRPLFVKHQPQTAALSSVEPFVTQDFPASFPALFKSIQFHSRMMGAASLSSSVSGPTDQNRIDSHLRKHYNMPSEAWWDRVQSTFSDLQSLLEVHKHQNVTLEGQDAMPEPGTPQALRKERIPTVKLVRSTTFAAEVTADNELLTCLAFGTISPGLYVEIVWDLLGEAQKEGLDMAMFRVLEGGTPEFEFRYQGCDFRLIYTYFPTLQEYDPLSGPFRS